MLASVVALKLFTCESDGRDRRSQALIGGETDNQGNPFATAKMLSTKFPLNIVLMQLSSLMETAGIYLNLKWVPREENVLADALTNEDFSAFTPNRRIRVNIDAESFPTLFKLLGEGKKLYEQLESAKVEQKKRPRVWPRVPDNKKLRVTQPW